MKGFMESKKIEIILSEDCDGKKVGDKILVAPEDVQKYIDLKVVRAIVNQEDYNLWLKPVNTKTGNKDNV